MMVELWRWGLPWVVKGWVYWYGSRFAVIGVGLGLPWVWVEVRHRRLWGLWDAFFIIIINGRLWVASGGGVRCV